MRLPQRVRPVLSRIRTAAGIAQRVCGRPIGQSLPADDSFGQHSSLPLATARSPSRTDTRPHPGRIITTCVALVVLATVVLALRSSCHRHRQLRKRGRLRGPKRAAHAKVLPNGKTDCPPSSFSHLKFVLACLVPASCRATSCVLAWLDLPASVG